MFSLTTRATLAAQPSGALAFAVGSPEPYILGAARHGSIEIEEGLALREQRNHFSSTRAGASTAGAMANRHAHKKLRAEVRARMRTTGESYQRALARIRARRRVCVALTPTLLFGHERAIATIEMHGIVMNILVGSSGSPLLASGPLGRN